MIIPVKPYYPSRILPEHMMKNERCLKESIAKQNLARPLADAEHENHAFATRKMEVLMGNHGKTMGKP